MRRPAKPFTVEVRKSRKSPSANEPLITAPTPPIDARNDTPGTAALVAARKLFGETVAPSMGQVKPATDPAELARAEARNRILPDLSWQPPAPLAEEEPKRRGRPKRDPDAVAAPAKPRKPAAKRPDRPARPIALPPAQAAPEPIPSPLASRAVPRARIVIRRRHRGEPNLPAGERWKRRLPPALW